MKISVIFLKPEKALKTSRNLQTTLSTCWDRVQKKGRLMRSKAVKGFTESIELPLKAGQFRIDERGFEKLAQKLS